MCGNNIYERLAPGHNVKIVAIGPAVMPDTFLLR
jgi:hypothetical protein